jgi:hypothetical protein
LRRPTLNDASGYKRRNKFHGYFTTRRKLKLHADRGEGGVLMSRWPRAKMVARGLVFVLDIRTCFRCVVTILEIDSLVG